MSEQEGQRNGLKGLAAFLVLAAAGLAIGYFTPMREHLTTENIRAIAERLGPWGPVLILAVGAVAPLAFLPRWPVCFLAGLLYGVAWGGALANVAGTIGATLHFFAARTMLAQSSADLLRRCRIDPAAIPRNRMFAFLVLLRAFPLSNSAATNVLAGALKMQPAGYIAATFLGMLPSTLMYAAWGKLMKRPDPAFYYLAFGLLLVILAGAAVARRFVPALRRPPGPGPGEK